MASKFVRGNKITVAADIPEYAFGKNPPAKGDRLVVVKRIYAGWMRVKNILTGTFTKVRNGPWLIKTLVFGNNTSLPGQAVSQSLDMLIRTHQVKELQGTVAILEQSNLVYKNENQRLSERIIIATNEYTRIELLYLQAQQQIEELRKIRCHLQNHA